MDEEQIKREEADDQLINGAFQQLLDSYLSSRHRKKVDLITKAFNFARQAHKGVRRLSGEPYIMHPIAVAQIACAEIGLGSTSICAALLHDVVEDTDYTIGELREMGFPKPAIDAVELLTHDEAVPYMEYVAKLKDDPIAKAVKLADLKHNSDLSRIDHVTEKDLQRIEKYRKAAALLED
mgnify:CR=1 FL=1